MVRVGRDEERVQVVVVVGAIVEPDDARARRGDLGDEREDDDVLARMQQARRDKDVRAIPRVRREARAVDRCVSQAPAAEVEDRVTSPGAHEPDGDVAGGAIEPGDVEGQGVAHRADRAPPLLGEGPGDTPGHEWGGGSVRPEGRRVGGDTGRHGREEGSEMEHWLSWGVCQGCSDPETSRKGRPGAIPAIRACNRLDFRFPRAERPC